LSWKLASRGNGTSFSNFSLLIATLWLQRALSGYCKMLSR
jgi:hypothetical protein